MIYPKNMVNSSIIKELYNVNKHNRHSGYRREYAITLACVLCLSFVLRKLRMRNEGLLVNLSFLRPMMGTTLPLSLYLNHHV